MLQRWGDPRCSLTWPYSSYGVIHIQLPSRAIPSPNRPATEIRHDGSGQHIHQELDPTDLRASSNPGCDPAGADYFAVAWISIFCTAAAQEYVSLAVHQ